MNLAVFESCFKSSFKRKTRNHCRKIKISCFTRCTTIVVRATYQLETKYLQEQFLPPPSRTALYAQSRYSHPNSGKIKVLVET